jgi:hypothetical protein
MEWGKIWNYFTTIRYDFVTIWYILFWCIFDISVYYTMENLEPFVKSKSARGPGGGSFRLNQKRFTNMKK